MAFREISSDRLQNFLSISLSALSRKAIFAMAVALLPLPIAFYLSYTSSRENLSSRILNDQTIVAESYEGQVYQFLEMIRIRAVDFASDGFIRDHVQSPAADRNHDLSSHLLRNKKPLDPSIRSISIVALDGRIVGSTDRSAIGTSIAGTPAFEQGKKSTTVVDETRRLLVATPITSRTTARPIGILVNEIPLTELDKVMSGMFNKSLGAITWNAGRPKTMEAYLVNRSKSMLTSSIFVKDAPLRMSDDTEPVRRCLDNREEMTGFYRDYRGIEVAGASMCFPATGWTLVVKSDADEVFYPPLHQMRRNAVAASGVVAAILLIFFVLFYRNVIAPLRRMASSAQKIAAGDFDKIEPIRTADEVGMLSSAFHNMANQIESRTALLQESEQKFRAIFDSVHDGILVADADTRKFVLGNSTITRMLGYSSDELQQLGVEDIHPAEDIQSNVEHFIKMARREITIVPNIRIKRKDGSVFYGDIGASPMSLEGKNYLIGIFRDVTEQKQREEELRKLTAAIEHSVNVIFITNRDGTIEYVNPTFEAATGWSRDEAIGKTPGILASGTTTRDEYDELWNTIRAGKTWRGSFQNKRKDGKLYWGSSVISPIRNERGDITHFLAVQEDITERKKAEERIKFLASYDELTGLINRSQFIEAFDSWLHMREQAGGATGSLLLIDIDELKYVNDTYGHTMGDECIRRIGGLLRRTLKDMDIQTVKEAGGLLLGRLGGDEFAAFLPDAAKDEGVAAAERIRRAVEGFRLMEGASHLTVSISVVSYPEHGISVKELFTKADAALFHTKRMGKNKTRLFSAEDRDLEFMHSRFKQKEMIQTAITEDRFIPWFQPILTIREGTISHYESLARLSNEDGSVMLPRDFIETAEVFGMISAIDGIIMEKTMRLQARAARQGRRLAFGMNLSGRELGNDDTLVFIQNKIRETGADPSMLIFEITETAAVHDLERAIRFVNALKAVGCRISLDDFGVGFTSFLYLREMSVDYVKIDGSFVRDIHINPQDRLFVKAISDVARGMGIKTVAEFVETEQALDVLRELEIDYAQGYLVGKPAPEILASSRPGEALNPRGRPTGGEKGADPYDSAAAD